MLLKDTGVTPDYIARNWSAELLAYMLKHLGGLQRKRNSATGDSSADSDLSVSEFTRRMNLEG